MLKTLVDGNINKCRINRMSTKTPVEYLVAACELAGGQSALAAELTNRFPQDPVSPARIWNWINRDGGAPAEYCAAIEEIVGKKVTRQQLRPNDWKAIWPELLTAEKGRPFHRAPDKKQPATQPQGA